MNDSIRSESIPMLSQLEIFLFTCIRNMNMSSPLKRILNNLKIQIIFEYFMDIYKLFPYGNTSIIAVKRNAVMTLLSPQGYPNAAYSFYIKWTLDG